VIALLPGFGVHRRGQVDDCVVVQIAQRPLVRAGVRHRAHGPGQLRPGHHLHRKRRVARLRRRRQSHRDPGRLARNHIQQGRIEANDPFRIDNRHVFLLRGLLQLGLDLFELAEHHRLDNPLEHAPGSLELVLGARLTEQRVASELHRNRPGLAVNADGGHAASGRGVTAHERVVVLHRHQHSREKIRKGTLVALAVRQHDAEHREVAPPADLLHAVLAHHGAELGRHHGPGVEAVGRDAGEEIRRLRQGAVEIVDANAKEALGRDQVQHPVGPLSSRIGRPRARRHRQKRRHDDARSHRIPCPSHCRSLSKRPLFFRPKTHTTAAHLYGHQYYRRTTVRKLELSFHISLRPSVRRPRIPLPGLPGLFICRKSRHLHLYRPSPTRSATRETPLRQRMALSTISTRSLAADRAECSRVELIWTWAT